MLQIYNSLTKHKEAFKPIEPDAVRIYVCGMTVYDYCHLGHARAVVVFDVVVRYLRARGYRVTYVRNITDIDDKIIRRAKENNEEIGTLTARFINAMHEDFAALNVLAPDAEPRATEFVPQIQAMIAALLEKGYAYRAANGDIYYDVSRFGSYGALSGQQLGELRAGARVEIDEAKDDPLDFVLWKTAKPGEPSWDSPWGPGRPGWHIECSAMSTHCLGAHFDIHGGGADLKFPHHDSEIAQSEASTGRKFVNLWMHNGHVRVDEQKMSKSLGNFFTIREVLPLYDPEIVRYLLLSAHYRSPLNYSDRSLEEAKEGLTTLYLALRGLEAPQDLSNQVPGFHENEYASRFLAAMDDDFNTPQAKAALFSLAHEINRVRAHDHSQAKHLGALLRYLGGLFGLLQRDADEFLQGGRVVAPGAIPSAEALGMPGVEAPMSTEEVESLIEQRAEARRRKNWSEADRIREELKAKSIILEDGEGSVTTWRRD